ncbi:MAG: RNA polymerase sigma factor [Phycisphaerales bacterium JB040]
MGAALTIERESESVTEGAPRTGIGSGLAREDLSQDPGLGDLVERARAGEERAWEELIGVYGRRVFALAKSRVRSPELAEEIAQSVFATVAVKLRGGQYRDTGRFEAWLFRIAMNRVRDEIRRQRRNATPTDPSSLVGIGDGARASGASGRAEPDGEGELGLLRRALSELSDSDREVVELRHHGQMSFKEMAEVLDEPMGTLLARHHRALKKLRGLLDGYAGTQDKDDR